MKAWSYWTSRKRDSVSWCSSSVSSQKPLIRSVERLTLGMIFGIENEESNIHHEFDELIPYKIHGNIHDSFAANKWLIHSGREYESACIYSDTLLSYTRQRWGSPSDDSMTIQIYFGMRGGESNSHLWIHLSNLFQQVCKEQSLVLCLDARINEARRGFVLLVGHWDWRTRVHQDWGQYTGHNNCLHSDLRVWFACILSLTSTPLHEELYQWTCFVLFPTSHEIKVHIHILLYREQYNNYTYCYSPSWLWYNRLEDHLCEYWWCHCRSHWKRNPMKCNSMLSIPLRIQPIHTSRDSIK